MSHLGIQHPRTVTLASGEVDPSAPTTSACAGCSAPLVYERWPSPSRCRRATGHAPQVRERGTAPGSIGAPAGVRRWDFRLSRLLGSLSQAKAITAKRQLNFRKG